MRGPNIHFKGVMWQIIPFTPSYLEHCGDFLCFQDDEELPKWVEFWGLLLRTCSPVKVKNLLLVSKFFPIRAMSYLKEEKMKMAKFLPLKVYPFTVISVDTVSTLQHAYNTLTRYFPHMDN